MATNTVRQLAPQVAEVLDRLEVTTWRSLDPQLLDRTAVTVAGVHGHSPLPRPGGAAPEASERAPDDATAAALDFAQQFATDVSAVTDEQRTALHAALGETAFTYAQAVYVLDVVSRARAVLERVLGEPAVVAGSVEPYGDLWTGIEAFIAVVPGLQALDPVTTELMRLRLARQHDCRICKSLRSYSAIAAGADDDTFAAVDTYETSDLDEATKVALALVDALVWTPGRVDDHLVGELHRHHGPAALVEMVLDAARNSANKFAVSMRVDDPHVTEGYEVYDVAADGTTTYGLDNPALAG
jgi:hypothetical protein